MTDDSYPDDIFCDDDPYHPPYAPSNEERFDTLRQEIWYKTRWGVALNGAGLLIVGVHAWNRPVTGPTDQLIKAGLLVALVDISVLFVGKLVFPFRDELMIPIPDVTALPTRLTTRDPDREAPDSKTTDAQGDSDASEY
jgi:hypothetical protein